MEADEYLTEEDIGMLLRELDCITFSELAESYFYDVMENLPDNAIDIYNTMEQLRETLFQFLLQLQRVRSKVTSFVERYITSAIGTLMRSRAMLQISVVVKKI